MTESIEDVVNDVYDLCLHELDGGSYMATEIAEIVCDKLKPFARPRVLRETSREELLAELARRDRDGK